MAEVSYLTACLFLYKIFYWQKLYFCRNMKLLDIVIVRLNFMSETERSVTLTRTVTVGLGSHCDTDNHITIIVNSEL